MSEVNLESPEPVQEEHLDGTAQATAGEAEHEEDEGLIETVSVGTQKMVPVAELIKYRKAAKAAEAKLKEQGLQIEDINGKLAAVSPYVEKLKANPKLIKQLEEDTAPSRSAEHNAEDLEAVQHAQDYGLIDLQGQLDVARARRQLNQLEKMAERIADKRLAPVQRQAAMGQVEHLKRSALSAKSKSGEIMATPEAVDMAYQIVPAELAVQEGVAPIMMLVAAGLDRYLGRSPKKAEPEYGEPIYTEPSGRRTVATLSPEAKRLAEKVGLSEKDLQTFTPTAGGRGGIPLE